MEVWEIALLLVASYVAVISLIRLMTVRRDALIRDMRSQMEAERLRRESVDRKKRRAEKRRAQKAA